MKTPKMEFDMATVEGRKNKEFDEEFNTDMMLGPKFET